MERKEITAWGMNTWTKKHGLVMFDEFPIGKIKERITNYVEMQEGDEYGTWECIEIKILQKFGSYDAPDMARGNAVFYAGRSLRVRCTSAGLLAMTGFSNESNNHIDHLDAAYKLKIVLVKKSK